MTTSNPLFHYIADSTPLGFFAFAIQTFYAGSIYAEWITHNAALTFAPAIWYGGAAQVITGILQLLRGDKVGGTVFCAFGLNWISTGYLTDPQYAILLTDSYQGASNEMAQQSGVYFIAWALFGLVYLIANLRSTLALVCLSVLVCGNFLFLGIFSFTGNVIVEKIAGYCMMLTAINAFYLGTAALWKETAVVQLPLLPLSNKQANVNAPSAYRAKLSATDSSADV